MSNTPDSANAATAALPLAPCSGLADRIISYLEGNFRDWLSPQEYAEARPTIENIIEDTIRGAVNAECTCGGHGPKDPKACPACMVWHRLTSPNTKTCRDCGATDHE